MKILTLVGVSLLRAVLCDQSETSIPQEQPIGDPENEGTRQVETPEVVLQLKYDEGELKRIYLTQFRKPGNVWSPSVSDRSNLCADLCHAGLGGSVCGSSESNNCLKGLGGSVCGSSCSQLIPLGLHSVLVANSTDDSDVTYGQPRVGVCPVLCENFMGEPLCQCLASTEKKIKVDWPAVCEAFCADGYILAGCDTCEAPTTALPTAGIALFGHRALSTVAGWSAWCDVQCRQGHGGAACNCDRTPFQ